MPRSCLSACREGRGCSPCSFFSASRESRGCTPRSLFSPCRGDTGYTPRTGVSPFLGNTASIPFLSGSRRVPRVSTCVVRRGSSFEDVSSYVPRKEKTPENEMKVFIRFCPTSTFRSHCIHVTRHCFVHVVRFLRVPHVRAVDAPQPAGVHATGTCPGYNASHRFGW